MYPKLVGHESLERFASFDLDHDGVISVDEIWSATSANATKLNIERGNYRTTKRTLDGEFIKIDLNEDGMIQPNEFDWDLKAEN